MRAPRSTLVIGLIALATSASLLSAAPSLAQFSDPQSLCGPPVHGRALVDPPELFSKNGVLNVTLTLIGQRDPVFDQVLCWVYTFPGKHGPKLLTTPPTLHVKQGDRLEVTLVNDLLVPTPDQNNRAELSIDRRIGETGMGAMPMPQDETLPCGQQVVDPV